MNVSFHDTCKLLIDAFKRGKLGQTRMPEDANPGFKKGQEELRLAYFTLPMALNYQRDSYKLWEAALKTVNDPQTRFVFDVKALSEKGEDEVRAALMKYKIALQPNKHVNTWRVIAQTIYREWGSFKGFVEASDSDLFALRELVQMRHKKGFPYLSGPKIFNYWSFILSAYGGVSLKNRDQIGIAPDTHITQCSVRLGVITQDEALSLTKDEIADRWRGLLAGSGIDPIDMHPPLWFWSRNGFVYDLK